MLLFSFCCYCFYCCFCYFCFTFCTFLLSTHSFRRAKLAILRKPGLTLTPSFLFLRVQEQKLNAPFLSYPLPFYSVFSRINGSSQRMCYASIGFFMTWNHSSTWDLISTPPKAANYCPAIKSRHEYQINAPCAKTIFLQIRHYSTRH